MLPLPQKEKGISLYITLILTSIILAVGLGMSLILLGQLRMTKEIGDSLKAFYAADAGIEHALSLEYDDMWNYGDIDYLKNGLTDIFGTEYGYEVEITCCEEGEPSCKLSAALACPDPLSPEDECTNTGAGYFCYKSKGTYKGVTRAIEIKR